MAAQRIAMAFETKRKGMKRVEQSRNATNSTVPKDLNRELYIIFGNKIDQEVWIMQMHKSNYKIEVTYKTREEAERRHVVNRKLAQIINLSAGSAAVR